MNEDDPLSYINLIIMIIAKEFDVIKKESNEPIIDMIRDRILDRVMEVKLSLEELQIEKTRYKMGIRL